MHPERIVRTLSDLKKALADLDREGRTILNLGGRKVLVLPLDQTDELTDAQFERMLTRSPMKEQLDKAIAQAESGIGIADDDLDAFFHGEDE